MVDVKEEKMDDKGSVKIKVPGLNVLRKNPWILATVVLAIALIVSLIYSASSGVSEKVASDNLLNYIDSLGKGSATVVSSEVDDGMYNIIVNYNGQDIPVYVSMDGNYLIADRLPLTAKASTPSASSSQTQQTPDVPKSDKPKVELFVMSYCPFGTQAEKGALPVATLLKDKIDFKIRFVNYAMHPSQGEVEENTRQYCIQKTQTAKFIPYLKCFLTAGDSPGCLTETGVDKSRLDSCYKETDVVYSITKNLEDKSSWLSGQFPLYLPDNEDGEKYGVQGSPTWVINGQQVSVGRDAVSVLNAVCAAFNEKPSECDTQLDAGTPSSGFGWDKASASNAAQCGV